MLVLVILDTFLKALLFFYLGSLEYFPSFKGLVSAKILCHDTQFSHVSRINLSSCNLQTLKGMIDLISSSLLPWLAPKTWSWWVISKAILDKTLEYLRNSFSARIVSLQGMVAQWLMEIFTIFVRFWARCSFRPTWYCSLILPTLWSLFYANYGKECCCLF